MYIKNICVYLYQNQEIMKNIYFIINRLSKLISIIMRKYINLTMLQMQMVRHMQKEQSYYFNVNDGTNAIPYLKDRGFLEYNVFIRKERYCFSSI